MKRRLVWIVIVTLLATWPANTLWGRGRGGGGGGARGGGGGGFHGGGMPSGGARPSGGGFSGGGYSGGGYRPSPSRPSSPGGMNRSSGGLGVGGGGVQRSNLVHTPGAGGGIQIGGRPQIDPGAGITRSDLRPGGGEVRPGAGGGGVQQRLPNTGAGDRRPGASTATLPGLGPRPGAGGGGVQHDIASGSRLGAGGAGTRFSRESIPQRHENLAGQFDQLQNNWGDGDWHSWTGPNGGQINHIGFWGPNGYWGHTGAWGPDGGHWGHSTGIGPNGAYGRTNAWGPGGHWSRAWGGWYNGYGPAWGNGRWDYLWNQYPVAMVFGCTMWGLNAVSYAMGIDSYSNPYYDSGSGSPVAYDEPTMGDPESEAADADPATDPLTQTFDQARAAFKANDFEQALQLTDQALQQAPRDAAINEFRSLCLFAVGRYREAAATIHAVLAAGPGWDWTTMISLYSSQDVYLAQLQKLQAAVASDPQAADARFLLAYHELTADHADAAVALWRQVVQLQPGDKLSADLLQMYGPTTDVPPPTVSTTPPDLEQPAYPLDKLLGNWKAEAGGGEFSLSLGVDDAFTWQFTRDGQPQSMTGAYVVRGNNLVMQPDSGGTMLSTITLTDNGSLEFVPIGDSEKLTFRKS